MVLWPHQLQRSGDRHASETSFATAVHQSFNLYIALYIYSEITIYLEGHYKLLALVLDYDHEL